MKILNQSIRFVVDSDATTTRRWGFAGSKFFSVLDLNQAYHQIESDEQSRYITFSTHVGLRRYKRLFFRVTSAAEIYHNIIGEMLIGIPGVVNTSHDILIHANPEGQHDNRYREVLNRIE